MDKVMVSKKNEAPQSEAPKSADSCKHRWVIETPEDSSEGTANRGRCEICGVECKHHWVIDSPEGMESRGQCKVCRVEKNFKNSMEYSAWTSHTRSRPGRRPNAAKKETS